MTETTPREKRRNVTRACDVCKARKRRCNGLQPCSFCQSREFECAYRASYRRGRQRFSSGDALSSFDGDGGNAELPVGSGTTSAWQSRAPSPSGDALIAPGQYIGPASPFWFLRRAFQVSTRGTTHTQLSPRTSIFASGDREAGPIAESLAETPLYREQHRGEALVRHFFDYAAPTYRFYHESTVLLWLGKFDKLRAPQSAQDCALLMVLATACLYNPDRRSDLVGDPSEQWQEAETYFQAVQAVLSREEGKVTLESIQSRLSSCLFLLNTSRANQAWYMLGTVIQLCSALGLHLRRNPWHESRNQVLQECQRRTFWSVYTLDVYLSLMLGRPPLLHDDDITQEDASFVNDEDVVDGGLPPVPSRDCVSGAAIHHARLARILKRISREQTKRLHGGHAQQSASESEIARHQEELLAWDKSLPAYLSAAIQPSSLIAILARQHTVLRMAYAHATMVLYRPSLLGAKGMTEAVREQSIQHCVKAAEAVLNIVRSMQKASSLLPAFWYFQYITFNAISIIYVALIQHARGRSHSQVSKDDASNLFALAEHVQGRLAVATHAHAPGLRYSTILEGLQHDVRRRLHERAAPPIAIDPALSGGEAPGSPMLTSLPNDQQDEVISWPDFTSDHPEMSIDTELPFDVDFWSYLESMPFNEQW